jgi:cytochrome c peroxidase
MQRERFSYHSNFESRLRPLKLSVACLFLFGGGLAVWSPSAASADGGDQPGQSQIGREVSVAKHLQDDSEFRLPLAELVAHGRLLFSANWTEQEGGGRPLTKGTGRPLSDPSRPLTGVRAFNRISAPDANSCAGCHNAPYGITGGGGDFVTNVFVLAQRFDSVSFDPSDALPTGGAVDEAGKPATLNSVANLRATTGMFGAGYIEMLARQMTGELQRTRDSLKLGETKELVAKGVSFGKLTLTREALWDTSQVLGLPRPSLISGDSHHPPSLVVRPWHQAGNVVSIREFTNNAYNHHHGIQPTERFGLDTDPDGDGFTNEMTRADVTAVSVWQATLQVPGRVIPRDPEVERAVLLGERTFERIGCANCHVPRLPLDRQGWVYSEPNPFNPPGNLRSGETQDYKIDLTSDLLPAPRLRPDASGTAWVEAYTDFKLHDICGPGEAEPLDMNQSQWSKKFKEGNCRFLTKRLWGAANEAPFFHHGLFTTLRQSVLAHAGEAKESRQAFQALPAAEADALIEFLKTLQVLPPGTRDRVVDENFRPRAWPPLAAAPQRAGPEPDKYPARKGTL